MLNINETKELSIKVKCGKAERELTFPVPAEMQQWIEQIKLPERPKDNDNPMCYTIEGGKATAV